MTRPGCRLGLRRPRPTWASCRVTSLTEVRSPAAGPSPARPDRRRGKFPLPRHSGHFRSYVVLINSCGARCLMYRSVITRETWPSCAWITCNGRPSLASSKACVCRRPWVWARFAMARADRLSIHPRMIAGPLSALRADRGYNTQHYYPEKTPGFAGGLAAFDSSVVK